MQVQQKGTDVYEVGSESTTRTYLVAWGTEGEYWSCTCTAYAINRNRRGGMGFAGRCKHIVEVEAIQETSEKNTIASLHKLAKALEDG